MRMYHGPFRNVELLAGASADAIVKIERVSRRFSIFLFGGPSDRPRSSSGCRVWLVRAPAPEPMRPSALFQILATPRS